MQRATEISYSNFAHHLHTNTIGPIITAQRLLATGLPIGTIVFMSSDSGSALNFRDFEWIWRICCFKGSPEPDASGNQVLTTMPATG